jgi:hypothetical protein
LVSESCAGRRAGGRAGERASGKGKRRAHLGHLGNELLHLLLLAADHGVRVGKAHGLAHWEPAQIVLLDALTHVAAAAVPVGWGWKGGRGVVRNAARGVCGIISRAACFVITHSSSPSSSSWSCS